MLDIKGSFRVNKVRAIQSNIQYAVLFLSDRMLFAKIGGQFADGGLGGAIAGGVVGGAIGGLLGSAIDQKMNKKSAEKNEKRVRNLAEMSADEVLHLDKNNFELLFGDITTIEMKKSAISLNGPRTGVMSIEGLRKERLDIAPNQDFEECRRTVAMLLQSKLRQM